MNIKESWEKYKDIILFVVLPSISFLSYLYMYFYELGYALVFHIPYEFISINIFSGTFVLIFWVICLIAFFLVVSAPSITYMIPGKYIKARMIMRLFIPYIIIVVAFFLLYPTKINFWDALLPALIIYILMLIVGTLGMIIFSLFNIIIKKIQQYLPQKVKKDKEQENITTQNTANQEIQEKNYTPNYAVLYSILTIFSLLFFLFIPMDLSYRFGKQSAESKAYFYVYALNATPKGEFVILKIYNDTFFCAHFDRTKQTVDDHIFIIKFDENQKATLHRELVGPLKSTNQQSFNEFAQEHFWGPFNKTFGFRDI